MSCREGYQDICRPSCFGGILIKKNHRENEMQTITEMRHCERWNIIILSLCEIDIQY